MTVVDDIQICCHDEDNSVQPSLKHGVYEPHVQVILHLFCRDKKNILDIGANYGQHTVFMSKLNPEADILAIEASVDNISILESTIAANACSNIRIHQAYLSDTEKEIVFYHEKGNAACAFGCTTDYGTSNHNEIGKKIVTQTLDNIVDFKPDFIKMDIEGAELLAIEGGLKIFEGNPPLLIELNKFTSEKFYDTPIDKLIDKIQELGYNAGIVMSQSQLVSVSIDDIKNGMKQVTMMEVLFYVR